MIRDYEVVGTDKIVLVGYGEEGKVIENGLRKNGVENYYLCDQKFEKNVSNKQYICYQDLHNVKDSKFIIASSKYCIDIYKELKKQNIDSKNIFTARKLYRDGSEKENEMLLNGLASEFAYIKKINNLYAYLDNGWLLNNLDVMITERCSLKCRYCCALIPYYDKKNDYCENDIYEGFDNLLSLGCYINSVSLMGGEPFMNQKMMRKFLEKYGNDKHIATFQIITNGTIIPDNFTVELLKKINNVYIIFSNYESLSINMQKAVKKLTDNNIVVAIEQKEDIKAEKNTLWLDYGAVKKYNRSSVELQEMYDKCLDGRYCYTLLKNRLFICNRIAHGVNLGKIPENLYRTVFDLRNQVICKQDKEEIKIKCKDFLLTKKFPEACDWCNRGAGILANRAEQVEKGVILK